MRRGRTLGWDRLEDRTCRSAGASATSMVSTIPVTKPSPWDAWQAKLDAQYAGLVKADVVFFGDSISYNFGYLYGRAAWSRKIAPLNAVDYGVPGDLTQNLLWRFKTTSELANPPKVAVVEIGLNNVLFGLESPGTVLAGIRKVVQTIRTADPHTKVLVLGIFPTDEPTSWFRTEETVINSFLPQLADGRNVFYLDPGADLVARDGSVVANTEPGLVHPNAQGYATVADAIAPTLQALLATASATPARAGIRGR